MPKSWTTKGRRGYATLEKQQRVEPIIRSTENGTHGASESVQIISEGRNDLRAQRQTSQLSLLQMNELKV